MIRISPFGGGDNLRRGWSFRLPDRLRFHQGRPSLLYRWQRYSGDFRSSAGSWGICGGRNYGPGLKCLPCASWRAESTPLTHCGLSSSDVSRIDVARPWRRVCHRAIAGGWIRGVLEEYVAGSSTRGRPEGRSDPRSQQPIRESSGLLGEKNYELHSSGKPNKSNTVLVMPRLWLWEA